MKILDIQHRDVDGSVLWQDANIPNLLHQDGEEFLLRAVFTGGQVSSIIPTNYYLGLDNRIVVSATDTFSTITSEPAGFGYRRPAISSAGAFAVDLLNQHFIATSPVVVFSATTGSWGPVANLFLATSPDNSGVLISTAVLAASLTLTQGQSVTMRIGLTLVDTPSQGNVT